MKPIYLIRLSQNNTPNTIAEYSTLVGLNNFLSSIGSLGLSATTLKVTHHLKLELDIELCNPDFHDRDFHLEKWYIYSPLKQKCPNWIPTRLEDVVVLLIQHRLDK
jgi:hypothetical protein